MCIDQGKSKGLPKAPERRQAPECHEKPIETSQEARNREKTRKADLYPVLGLAWRVTGQ